MPHPPASTSQGMALQACASASSHTTLVSPLSTSLLWLLLSRCLQTPGQLHLSLFTLLMDLMADSCFLEYILFIMASESPYSWLPPASWSIYCLFFLHSFFLKHYLLVCVRLCICVCMYLGLLWEDQRTTWGGWFFPPIVGIPWLDPRRSGSAASVFIHWAFEWPHSSTWVGFLSSQL